MNTTTLESAPGMNVGRPGFFGFLGHRSIGDWAFAALVIAAGVFAFQRYNASMDVYERAILIAAMPALISLGWFWGALRLLTVAVGASSLLAISLYNRSLDSYGADLAQAEHVFLLKYFLSSQSAIMWMSVLFFMSTAVLLDGFRRQDREQRGGAHRLRAGVVRGVHGAHRHHGPLVREPPDRTRHRPHSGQQPVRSVRAVLLADLAVLSVLRIALPDEERSAPS